MSELQPLVDALYGPDPLAADSAVERLAAHPSPLEVIREVVPLARSAPSARPATQRRLGILSARLGPVVLPHLMACIKEGEWATKLAAAPCFAGLSAQGQAERDLLAVLERAGDMDAERLAIESLGWMGATAQAGAVAWFARGGRGERFNLDDDWDVSSYEFGKLSSYAIEAIARMAAGARDQHLIGSLMRLLDQSVRQHLVLRPNVSPGAVTLVERLAADFNERHIDALIGLWGHDADPRLQRLCLSLLGAIAPVRAAGFLLELAMNPAAHDDVREAASVALGELRSAAVAQRLNAALADGRSNRAHLPWAASAMYVAGGDWSADASFYERILDHHPDSEPLAQLLYGLAVRRDARCQAPLIRGLDAAGSFARWTSALSLARLLGAAALPLLRHRVEDAGDELERCGMLAACVRAGQLERVDELQVALQRLGALSPLRSLWLVEMLDALRRGTTGNPEVFDAWRREVLVNDRVWRYFEEWGAMSSGAPEPVADAAALTARSHSTSPQPLAPVIGGPDNTAARAPAVFISYSRKDKVWLERFQVMLSPLKRNLRLSVWDDTRIVPGQWQPQIDAAMANASAALFLVSPEFLASDFVANNELPTLLGRADAHGLRVVWVLLSPCLWEHTVLQQYQCVNAGRPLTRLQPAARDDVIAKACRQLLLDGA